MRSYINYSLGRYGEALLDYERANDYKDFINAGVISGVITGVLLLGAAAAMAYQDRKLNETYSDEMEGSVRSYTKGQLEINIMEFGDLSEADKNHMLHFDKEKFKKILQDVFDIKYECSYNLKHEVVEGQRIDKAIGKFSIGKFNEDHSHIEEFSGNLDVEESMTNQNRREIAKAFAKDKVMAYCKSYLQEKILSDVSDGESKEFLTNILMNCLDDSHRQDLILTYDLRSGKKEKNMLYDFVAKNQDYNKVDRQKLAEAKAVYRKTAVDYFCGIYDEIVEERAKSESHFDIIEEEKKKEELNEELNGVPKISPSPLTASNVAGNVTQLGG